MYILTITKSCYVKPLYLHLQFNIHKPANNKHIDHHA